MTIKTLTLLYLAFSTPPQLGHPIEDFGLQDFRGKTHRLSGISHDRLVVLAYLGTECPLAKLYGPRLAALDHEFRARGVTFVGINANRQDSVTELAAYARIHGIQFPLLKDVGNRVADQLRAQRTPEVFVLDGQRRVRYWGRIDDQYGVGYVREEPSREDLRQALVELLAGRPVSQPVSPSVGCFIGRIRAPRPDSPVNYSQQISRIFQKHCVACHRDGEIAPFPLTNYEEVVGWSDTIAEVIRDQRMPPWHASPEHGTFVNSRQLSDHEKELVYRWVADGAPEGDPRDLPPLRTFVNGWRLPSEPDQVISMRAKPYMVPAEGTVEYQYFVVDPGFEEDKWVAAAEVIPGNRAVVHHAIVFVRPPGRVERDDLGWLAAYVPGQRATSLRAGQAYLVPARSRFVFQMHYTPIGSQQEDNTKVGLVFAEAETVRERVQTLIALNRRFEIPPHAEDHQVTARLRRFPKNATLLALAPHMHLRGKAFRIVAHHADQSQILLDVPNYDFNWQHAYELQTPMNMDDIRRIECIARFDNSAGNLVNPDPTATVRWGDQTWEEMVVAYFGVAIPVGDQATATHEPTETRLNDKERSQARRNANRFIRRFDKNKDQHVARDEVPQTFAVFAFDRFDQNNDGTITVDEAEDESARRIRTNERDNE